MKKKEIIEKLFGFTEATYYNWKKEKRPIIDLVGYFEEEELIEFLKTGKVKRLEKSTQDNINLEIFFADNAVFKIIEILDGFSLQELIEIENLKNIDLIPEEAEEVKAMDWVMEWIKESETTDEFLEILKKHNYTFLSIILNPLEIDGMIKNKQYVSDKIKKIEERKNNQEKMAMLESGIDLDDEVEIDDTVDDTDYDAEEKMRKDYMEMGLIEYEERNTLK